MSDRGPSQGPPAEQHRTRLGQTGRWLVVALALATLGGCEHGELSFNRDTGQFSVPIGAGSHK